MKIDLELAKKSSLWVWKEAFSLKQRFENNPPKKGYILFETGYGPSGLPHIGTFGEVFRTTMVRKAFERISDIPTKLIAFSDDLDGLRKVPDNVPNPELLRANLGKPLTQVPDPFGKFESFAHHNNAMLRDFLDRFGFEYEFKSATECYKSGMFDETLLSILKNYQAVLDVMLPTLGNERRETYSPFLPICPKTGKVLQAKVIKTDAEKGTIIYVNEDNEEVETKVTGGACKLQWKPDWSMRWTALGVDYEMHGKDLTPSVEVSVKICKAIGARAPKTYVYEMFLDEKGEKISKSKGNGISIDDWLKYGTDESLALYMFIHPNQAKKLHFDQIPKHVDDYLVKVEEFKKQDEAKRIDNPVFHISSVNGLRSTVYGGTEKTVNRQPSTENQSLPVNFAMLLNLAAACNTDSSDTMWGFISRYAPTATPENMPVLDKLVGYAIQYYNDFIKPNKKFRTPTDQERAAILDLREYLKGLSAGSPDLIQGPENIALDPGSVAGNPSLGDTIQTQVFEIGKKHQFENLRDWFKALYEVLLGQEQGPRMGSFIELYGVNEMIALIEDKVK
jgi:lysyl-tRNA synthetase class 1